MKHSLLRFIARRGYPTLLWSDQCTDCAWKSSIRYHNIRALLCEECLGDPSTLRIRRFKGIHCHLRRTVKLTFEELMMILIQIEACFNSRPLVSINVPAFLIGHPLKYRSLQIITRWSAEYLSTLYKYGNISENGTVCCFGLCDYMGKDGLARVVDVKTRRVRLVTKVLMILAIRWEGCPKRLLLIQLASELLSLHTK